MASGAKMLYANNATITWPMQVLGRKDGADMIKKGEGFVFNKISENLKVSFSFIVISLSIK